MQKYYLFIASAHLNTIVFMIKIDEYKKIKTDTLNLL